MEKFIELLKQRRIWAGIVGTLAFVLSIFNTGIQIDVPVITELLANFGTALAALITSVLSLLSYFKPKQ